MKAIPFIIIALLLFPFNTEAQRRKKKKQEEVPEVVQVIDTINEKEFNNFKWRNIGPFRGGRSVASSGVVGQPMTYYMGSTGGGIWKTVDDGITWNNVSDGFLNTGSVGAIGVSESNPNIVIAGMGEHAARGVMTSMGDGMYKSTDAGKTWNHMGLDKSRHISDVIIHPQDPNIILVSVQGAQYGPSKERGIYKSVDGGKTWNNVLFVNETTGASSLSMDMKNPLILYAAMWDHQRKPWTMISGGEGSGLYKSNDGGETWEKMKEGLPELFGKAGISVSRANPDRVFAVIEAEGKKGGIYRSDDAGKKWNQVNTNRINIARSWYYMEIFADPQDENIVYVLNAPVMKSIDGGKSFSRLSTPHGDNHHLWIHPHNNKVMINSNDGGANVSNNSGKSWSTQQNQPTSQFYRVITDNLVPYNVYGGQQDNSSISIKSRTNGRGIGWKDWHSVAGCESAYLAFDPDNPALIYGGCYQGIIEKYMTYSNEGKSIKEYPELNLGNVPKDFKFRYNWNAPIISSPHDRKTIYHAGNIVFKSKDEGQSWELISPDLTRDNPDQQGPGGLPFTNEAAGGENFNTLMYLTESIHEEGTLWAGSDDGLLHITKDGGQNWENVSPPGIGEGIINCIEVSPHDPATAYVAVMRYKLLDLKPYIFKTNDYGKTWKKITNGITDPHTFVRAVRADRKVKGLLYAGTETGMYISHDDGESWSKFQLNLPIVPINDIAIQDNDLVVATAGRSFWILDDIAPIQNMKSIEDSIALLDPKAHSLLFGGSSDEFQPGWGQNPKQGISIDYFLSEDLDSSDLRLEVLEGDRVIRTYSNQKDKSFKSWIGGPSAPQVIPSKKGFNRFTWDFRRENLTGVDKVFVYGNYNGSRVGPGEYGIRLVRGNDTRETKAKINPNPNIKANKEDYQDQQIALVEIERTITDIHESVNQMRSAKSQIQSLKNLLKENADAKSLIEMGDSIVSQINTWEENLIQPKQKTFQDVINYNNQLNAELMNLKDYIDSADPKLTNGARDRLSDLRTDWSKFESMRDQIIQEQFGEFNSLYKSLDLPVLIIDKKEKKEGRS